MTHLVSVVSWRPFCVLRLWRILRFWSDLAPGPQAKVWAWASDSVSVSPQVSLSLALSFCPCRSLLKDPNPQSNLFATCFDCFSVLLMLLLLLLLLISYSNIPFPMELSFPNCERSECLLCIPLAFYILALYSQTAMAINCCYTHTHTTTHSFNTHTHTHTNWTWTWIRIANPFALHFARPFLRPRRWRTKFL